MCEQWINLLGGERDRAHMLRRAYEIVAIHKPNALSRGGRGREAFTEQARTVEDRMRHVLFCFQQMETEALVGEKLGQRRLEREIKIQIRERIGYKGRPQQEKRQQESLPTNHV